jgi:hypothetical protein
MNLRSIPTKLLPKKIWKEEFQYYSEKSIEELKNQIQELFSVSQDKIGGVNLTGAFTSEFEFEMTPIWQLIRIRNFERSESYLKGRIFSDELNRTCVTFTVRPNSIFLMFTFLFPLFGLAVLTSDNVKSDKNDLKIVGFVFTLLVPAIMLVSAHLANRRIKKTFVETFNLKPIE